MSFSFLKHAFVLLFILLFAGKLAYANENNLSPTYMGLVGLNTIPSARMDNEGTARIGVSTLGDYNHAFIGMQIAKPLYVNLRQSMEVSSIGQKPTFVYPGMDIKLRLMDETRYKPELAFGMNSALGHKKFSSEYFALSKRVHDFDFTAGVAWGQMAGGGHIKNPFSMLSHFRQDRDLGDEDSSNPTDWFTGKEIGFFGGFEYHTPITGLSFKADAGGQSDYSIGVNYNPRDWFGFGASLVDGDTVMARLNLSSNLYQSTRKGYKDAPAMAASDGWFDKLWATVKRGGDTAPKMILKRPAQNGTDFQSILHLNDYQPSAMQIGRAARKLLADAKDDGIQTITIIPVRRGTKGKAITFNRRDLEQAAKGTGSPEEIWQDLEFNYSSRSISKRPETYKFKFLPELQLSFEEETTHLYRASAVVEGIRELPYGFTSGSSVRLNIADNLHRLYRFRDMNLSSARADADLYTLNRINVDRAYMGWMRTVIPDFHLSATAGYLEEMYAGYGGEALYRPFDSPFAIGVEGWNVYKRDPLTPLALGLYDQAGRFTGHLNLFYNIPQTDITAFGKIGKYLDGDLGGTIGMETQFDSGLKVKAHVTATNNDDKDIFNSSRNIVSGLSISVPFGDLPFIPEGSNATARIEPIGRDDGATINKPISLYETTEPLSYRHLGRNWQSLQE